MLLYFIFVHLFIISLFSCFLIIILIITIFLVLINLLFISYSKLILYYSKFFNYKLLSLLLELITSLSSFFVDFIKIHIYLFISSLFANSQILFHLSYSFQDLLIYVIIIRFFILIFFIILILLQRLVLFKLS